MKLAIVASMAVSVSALMGLSAYAQGVTPADIAAKAVPAARMDDGRPAVQAERLDWSSPRPTLQGDHMPVGRVSLAKAPTRVIGTANPVDFVVNPISSDISGAL